MRRIVILGWVFFALAACHEPTQPGHPAATSDLAPDADPTWTATLGAGSQCLPPASGLVSWWPGVPQPPSEQVVLDETFDTPNLNNWSPFGTGVVEAQDGALLAQTGTSGDDQNSGLAAGLAFPGDLDVVVDYSDFEVFAHGSPVDFGALTLLVQTPTRWINFERRFIDGANVIWADVGGAASPPAPVPYSDTFGQLRVQRIGDTVTLLFRRSSTEAFTTFYTGQWSDEPVQVVLYARNDNFGTGVRGRFDNLRVSANVPKALDVIGRNSGAFFGGSFSLGKVGQAFDFTKGGFITLTSQPQLSQGFTIEGWVAFDASGFDAPQEIFNNNQVFLRKNDASEGNTFGAFVTLADGTVEPRANSQTSAVPGELYHVAATWDGTELSLYVNGQLEAASHRPAPLSTQTVLPEIGQGEELSLTGNEFHGLIDGIAIANRAYTAVDIRGIFNAGAADQCSLR